MHSFQIRTLRSLGYRTRIALSNKSHLKPDWRTDYRVHLTIGGKRVVESLGVVVADGRLVIDCAPYEPEHDTVLVFHLVPARFTGATGDIARGELMFLNGTQDHYVEYYRDDGCAAGVLYQNGPFNHPKLSPKGTTLIQAPKFYASATVDSMLSVVNASADPAYDRVARLRLTLVGDGVRFAWTEDVAPFVPALISAREQLRKRGIALANAPRFACLYAMCENATVIPLTIVRDDTTGAIGVEHSLPPSYYSTVERNAVFARLKDSTLWRA